MMERLEKFLSFASHDPPPEEAHFKLSHYRNSNQLVLLDFVFSTCAVGTPAYACLCLPVRGTQTGGARRQALPADRADRESRYVSIAIANPIAIAMNRGGD